MKRENPFSPPEALLLDPQVNGKPRAESVRGAFPWLFVLRYLVGAAVVISGLVGLYWLCQSWTRLADQSIINPVFSPYRYLPVLVLKIGTGVAILARSKLSLVLTLLWMLAFVYVISSNGGLKYLLPEFFLNVAVLIGLLSFLSLLFARGRLR